MRNSVFLLAVFLALSTGCGDDATSGSGSSSGDVVTVRPGESIQDAVDSAPAGATIMVKPGTYVETHGNRIAIRIDKPLHLIAHRENGEPVRIVPGPGNTEGIMIDGTPAARIENVKIEGFTIEGFSENGIWPRYARNFEIIDNIVGDSDHVGIYPYLSADGLVKNNTAFGGLDSALWVAGSENIRVIDNEIYAAPTGLEVTVSKNVEATNNEIYNNVVGIGVYHNLATAADEEEDAPVRGQTGRFVENDVYDNNLPNPVTNGLVADLPTGLGVLIAGADGAIVERNTITDNGFAGIVLIDWCIATGDEDDDCKPDDNVIVDNVVTGNGTNPPDHPFEDLASDIIVLGEGTGNCLANNEYDYSPTVGRVETDSCPPA